MYEVNTEVCMFGFDWKVRIEADYDPPEPSVGIQGGFAIERLYLVALHDGDEWVSFTRPVEVGVPSWATREYEILHKALDSEIERMREYA